MQKLKTVLPKQINTPVKSKEAEAQDIRADVMDFVANGGEIYYAKPNETGRGKKQPVSRGMIIEDD